MVEISRGAKSFRLHHFMKSRRGHVADVGMTLVDLPGFVFVNLESGGAKAFTSEFHQQRQTDVPEPDNTRLGLFISNFIDQFILHNWAKD
jgi:hypothetical protein